MPKTALITGEDVHALLNPTNDYVFKRVFAEAPELLRALINDLRPDLPNITAVEILNPNIEPNELTGKSIILDVLARDADGHCYNVEVQVRRYGAWHKPPYSPTLAARLYSDLSTAGPGIQPHRPGLRGPRARPGHRGGARGF